MTRYTELSIGGEFVSIRDAGADDVSPSHSCTLHYDSRCNLCWLNIPHTQDRHTQEVLRHRSVESE